MPSKLPYRKTCAVCHRIVRPGTGTYYKGVLVHRTCKGLLKRYWWRFIE